MRFHVFFGYKLEKIEVRNYWFLDLALLEFFSTHKFNFLEIRLMEMSSMGIGSKPCLDIRPSQNQINDRSISISQLGKENILKMRCDLF